MPWPLMRRSCCWCSRRRRTIRGASEDDRSERALEQLREDLGIKNLNVERLAELEPSRCGCELVLARLPRPAGRPSVFRVGMWRQRLATVASVGSIFHRETHGFRSNTDNLKRLSRRLAKPAKLRCSESQELSGLSLTRKCVQCFFGSIRSV